MSGQDKLFQATGRVEDFAFDERVAQVFDDMVARSIPFYHEIQRIQADLVMDFLPDNAAVVCDLGCSTGTSIAYFSKHARCPDDVCFIGYDNSQAMLDKAGDKLSSELAAGRVLLNLADLSAMPTLPVCHVAILNWTLQFVRPLERETLLHNVFQALRPGGILLLSEKILGSDGVLNRLYIDHYLHFKTSQRGYSDTENQRKREALENVLIPYRLDENYALLKRAGFNRMDTYFQWFNFVCMIAVKS
jgi:tRNA (cmo5U34)-methyltransferase